MKPLITLGLSAIFLASCAVQRPLMDFTYVSTKIKKLPETPPEKLGEVESEWICQGKDGLGLMETAVNEALTKVGGNATYLKDASFTQKGSCVMVSGVAYK